MKQLTGLNEIILNLKGEPYKETPTKEELLEAIGGKLPEGKPVTICKIILDHIDTFSFEGRPTGKQHKMMGKLIKLGEELLKEKDSIKLEEEEFNFLKEVCDPKNPLKIAIVGYRLTEFFNAAKTIDINKGSGKKDGEKKKN